MSGKLKQNHIAEDLEEVQENKVHLPEEKEFNEIYEVEAGVVAKADQQMFHFVFKNNRLSLISIFPKVVVSLCFFNLLYKMREKCGNHLFYNFIYNIN